MSILGCGYARFKRRQNATVWPKVVKKGVGQTGTNSGACSRHEKLLDLSLWNHFWGHFCYKYHSFSLTCIIASCLHKNYKIAVINWPLTLPFQQHIYVGIGPGIPKCSYVTAYYLWFHFLNYLFSRLPVIVPANNNNNNNNNNQSVNNNNNNQSVNNNNNNNNNNQSVNTNSISITWSLEQ